MTTQPRDRDETVTFPKCVNLSAVSKRPPGLRARMCQKYRNIVLHFFVPANCESPRKTDGTLDLRSSYFFKGWRERIRAAPHTAPATGFLLSTGARKAKLPKWPRSLAVLSSKAEFHPRCGWSASAAPREVTARGPQCYKFEILRPAVAIVARNHYKDGMIRCIKHVFRGERDGKCRTCQRACEFRDQYARAR